MGSGFAHRRWRCCTALIAICVSVAVGLVSSPFGRAAAPLVGSDDWRYLALAELAHGGLLDEVDIRLYSSGVPVSVNDLSRAVERAVRRLKDAAPGSEITVSGSAAASAGPLKLTGPLAVNLTISARQASLIAELVAEFGPSFVDQSLANLSLRVPLGSPGGGMILSLSEAALSMPNHRWLSGMVAQSSASSAKPLPGLPNGSAGLSQLQDLLTPLAKPDSGGAQPQFQLGVPSPLGTLAVEVSSQAARRAGKDDVSEETQPARGFDLSTSVRLADILAVSAGFFTDDKLPQRATSTALGVVLGDKDGSGVSVGHRVTDVGNPSDPSGRRETVTSVDVKYSLPDVVGRAVAPDSSDSITVKAGYELYGRGLASSAAAMDSFQATASLVIDYRLLLGDAAFLQAGYRYERIRDLIASGAVWTKSELYNAGDLSAWLGLEPLKLDGSGATRTITSIDFGYRLMGDTSLLLGYKLIDFSDVGTLDFTKNLATAEVTIRF